MRASLPTIQVSTTFLNEKKKKKDSTGTLLGRWRLLHAPVSCAYGKYAGSVLGEVYEYANLNVEVTSDLRRLLSTWASSSCGVNMVEGAYVAWNSVLLFGQS